MSSRSVRIKRQIFREESEVQQDKPGRSTFSHRKSLVDYVRDNLTRAYRTNYYQRIISVCRHVHSSSENTSKIRAIFQEFINNANKYSAGENISGLLLFYTGYSVHMLEGGEDVVGRFYKSLSEVEGDIFENSRVVLIFNNINQTFFRQVIWREADPPLLMENLTSTTFEAMDKQIKNLIKKVYKICKDLREELEAEDVSADNAILPSSYNKHIPEIALIDYILAKDRLSTITKFSSTFDYVPVFDSYDEAIWPVPYDFTPKMMSEVEDELEMDSNTQVKLVE